MRDSVIQFFSSLHQEYLKQLGYKKTRHTFSRKMGSYTERIQFQGSDWNGSDGPWKFYINFGLEFVDLPPRIPARDFPATHCWTRIERIVLNAPKEYDLPAADLQQFASELVEHIKYASRVASQNIQQIRSNCNQRYSSRLTVPN